MDVHSANPDNDLLLRWKRERDAEAFAVLVQRYAGMVHSTCLRILKNHHAAEDLAQECFVALTQRPPHSGDRIGAWLHTVAVRRSINRRRADGRRSRREDLVALQADSTQSHEWDDLFAEVDDAIECLPEDLRDLVVRHYLEGKTHAAIAEALRISRTTVTSRIRHAVELIRKRLDRKGIALSAAILSGGIAALSGESAPAELVERLGKVALAGRAPIQKTSIFPQTAAHPFVLAGFGLLVASATLFTLWIRERPAAAPIGSVARAVPAEPVADVLPPSVVAQVVPTAQVSASVPAAVLAKLEVVVLLSDGQPVPGATVVAGKPKEKPWQGTRFPIRDADPNALSRASTNEQGIAVFDVPNDGNLVAAAYKSGIGWAVNSDFHLKDGRVSLTLEPFGAINLHVYDKATGGGVHDLKIEFGLFNTDSWDIPTVRQHLRELDVSRSTPSADSDGWFRLSDVLPQTYALYLVGKTKYAVPPVFTVNLGAGETRTLEFALEPGGSINGVVRNSKGEPVKNAFVFIRSVPILDTGERYKFHTTPDGVFQFTGLPAKTTYELVLSHPDYAQKIVSDLRMPEPVDIANVIVEMSEGRRVTGQIVDDQGQPIDKLTVMLYKLADRVDTDASGNFEIHHASPGVSPLQVFAESSREHLLAYDLDGFNRNMPEITVPATGDVAPLRVVVPRKRGGFVAGRVTTAAGDPVMSMRVSAKGRGTLDREATTDANGQFRIEGLAGASQVRVQTHSGDMGFESATLENVNVNSSGLTFTVHKQGRLSGRVINAATALPVPDYRIRTIHYSPGITAQGQWQVCSNADGAFLLDGVPPGPVTLEVDAAGYAPKEVAIEGPAVEQLATGVEIKLEGGWRGRVRVTDGTTGDALPGVQIRAWTAIDARKSLRQFSTQWLQRTSQYDHAGDSIDGSQYVTPSVDTQADGTAELPLMDTRGAFGIVAWMDGYAPAILAPLEKNSSNADVKIMLLRSSALRIHILGPHADYSFEARQLELPTQQKSSAFYCRLKWDGHGVASYEGLPPGAYGITVTAGEPPNRRQFGYIRVPVAAGETVDIDFDVAKAESAFGSVTGKVNTDLRAYIVFSRKVPGRIDEIVGQAFIENGAFRADGLPPGPATMEITYGDRLVKQGITVSVGAIQTVNVNLP